MIKRKTIKFFGTLAISAILLISTNVMAETPLLATLHRHAMRTSTIASNGDTNPYAVIVAPVSSGKIHQGDILIDNFNNLSNLQGTGTTIVDYNPSTKKCIDVVDLPRHLAGCPGGVGLTTAMCMLKTGWIIVGSTPSSDGTTATKSAGGLIVLDTNGHVAAVWSGPNINDPWGNVAWIDNGSTATLFVSMAGFDIPSPSVRDPRGYPVTMHKATILRLDLAIPNGKPPEIKSQTIIGEGFAARADRDAFLIGPTGLALGADGTLYASDALANRIVAIDNPAMRTDSGGTGRVVTQGNLLHRPLALITMANGHLLTCNGQNGQVVEIDPAKNKQLCAQWIDTDQAQQPPGSGDLFGMATSPDGKGFYYVEDDMNTLVEAK